MNGALLHDISKASTTAISHHKTSARMRDNHALSILPRLARDDRANKNPMRKKFRWKLLGTGAVLLLLFVWVLGPRERRERVFSAVNPYARPVPNHNYDYDIDIDEPPPPNPNSNSNPYPNPNPNTHPNTQDTAPDNPPAFPSSPLTFQTDPDPSKTVHCTAPYSSTSPLVQWALMIDAGSTGSRIHVYKFHNCNPAPEYEYEVFMVTRPGLSHFAGDPDSAAQSLDPLMERALAIVPQRLRKCTPVAVKATAGLRLLGPERSADILSAVRARLEAKYPFPVVKDGVVIMDGKDEGVYAWITANYLLDTIRSTTPATTPNYAVLDLGGASTQIVFKPAFTEPGAALDDGEHKYRLEFGGREHVLYQHSYLGYGLMHARKSVHRLVEFMQWPGGDAHEIANPCLARGTTREVEVPDGRDETKAHNVTMVGADVGGFEACNRVIELVMAKDAVCHVKPCSFNGVYQPSLLNTFPSGKVLLLSYFYDRLAPLLAPDNSTLPISTLATFAQRVCLGSSSWQEHWGGNSDALDELAGRPEYCLDLTFMHALLRLGYEFGAEREVHIAKQVNGTELGWCLGAAIALLDGSLECTA